MNKFIEYLLGTIFAVFMGVLLGLIYVYKTGGF